MNMEKCKNKGVLLVRSKEKNKYFRVEKDELYWLKLSNKMFMSVYTIDGKFVKSIKSYRFKYSSLEFNYENVIHHSIWTQTSILEYWAAIHQHENVLVKLLRLE